MVDKFIDIVGKYPRYSGKRVEATCEYQISEKCKKTWVGRYEDFYKCYISNSNKVLCSYCSRRLKIRSGRRNNGCKYKDIDDNFFEDIDTEHKAYFLGWIASDGSVATGSNVYLGVHKGDSYILRELGDLISKKIPIKKVNINQRRIIISSTKMVKDICNLLKIPPAKKSNIVRFPDLRTDNLKWAFLRGYFDGDGCVCRPSAKCSSPTCSIASNSRHMLEDISKFTGIKNSISGNTIQWNGHNALDFLSKLYDKAAIFLNRKRDFYLDWSLWVPSLGGIGVMGRDPYLKWNKSRKDAIPPFKARASDSGYDLTLLEKINEISFVEYYDTGIKIEPAYGWYFDMVPRSGLSKLGYSLANNVGIIDRSYRGTIIVPLVKIREGIPELKLPIKGVQIIPRPIVHFQLVEVKVDCLEDTERNDKGFGSTGR